jgi:peptidyl-prolyl cis-trans isomerase A (cyclophilin A)
MRRAVWIAWVAAAGLTLAGCSSTNETKKTAPAEKKTEHAPDVYKVNLDTSKGPVVIEVHRDWAPFGADHFYSLVKIRYFDGVRFYRVVRHFVAQFGINGDPEMNRIWATANLPDDRVKQSNIKGTVTYAAAGPNTRATQLFINLKDNKSLDKQGFAPIGKVVSGMDVVESFWNSYGEMAPTGQGPDPTKIEAQGNEYLEGRFPRLDYIRKATIQ